MAVLIETITDTDPASPTFGQKTVVEHQVPDEAVRPRAISRVRFDAVFAKACGEAYYLGARLALKAYAESSPLTDAKAAIARGLDALNNPPSDGIDFPLENWKTAPNDLDITGALLRGIIAVLVNINGFSDIEAKVDAALEIWRELP